MTEKQLDQVLAWINRQRVNIQKRKPLKKIPKGNKRNPNSCPIAVALNGKFRPRVERGWTQVDGADKKRRELKHPKIVTQFINEFDGGGIPELIK